MVRFPFKECQRSLVVVGLVLSNDLSGSVFLELTHYVGESIRFQESCDNVDVVWHNDEGVEVDPALHAHIVQAISNDAFDYNPAE